MKDNKIAILKHGVCVVCGKPRPRQTKAYCSRDCYNTVPRQRRRGEIHKRPRGGRIEDSCGYIQIRSPLHPDSQNGYVREHRLVMEKFLGRRLESWEFVHHKNGNRKDNRLENLEVLVNKKHFGLIRCPKCLYEFLIK